MIITTSKHEFRGAKERQEHHHRQEEREGRARLVFVSRAHGAAGGCVGVAGSAGNWATAGAALRQVPSSLSVPSPGPLGSFSLTGDERPPRTVGTALVIASSYLLQQVEARLLQGAG